MSQLILDEQLDHPALLPTLKKWITCGLLRDVQPRQRILDERVPELLVSLNRPTFITIDQDFWQSSLCHPNYCILYFALREDQQAILPDLLRQLLRRPDFDTRAERMGKVVRISRVRIEYWQFGRQRLERIDWKPTRPKRR